MSIIEEISAKMQEGKHKEVKLLVAQALDEGRSAKEILEKALLAGMDVIGAKFKNNEVYVPEVLVAARAMKIGVKVLKPHLVEDNVEPVGKVVIGTVAGDMHDIGKNLVSMMLEGKGLEVIDLGVDVSIDEFVNTVKEENADIVCLSALLTTTMGVMKDLVKVFEEEGIREKVKIMIGGAPVTQEYCDEIGADCFTVDAASCADMAYAFCSEKK